MIAGEYWTYLLDPVRHKLGSSVEATTLATGVHPVGGLGARDSLPDH
jgi:hypothetical protein